MCFSSQIRGGKKDTAFLCQYYYYYYFAGLGFELKAYTLSHSTSPFL
jgi:hypothetical protein